MVVVDQTVHDSGICTGLNESIVFIRNRVVLSKLKPNRVVFLFLEDCTTHYKIVTTKLIEIVCQSQHMNHNEIKSKHDRIPN
jgi:hypothetical protein